MKKLLTILPDLSGGGAERVAVNFIRQLDQNSFNQTLVIFQERDDLLVLIPDHVQVKNLNTIKTSRSFFALLKLLRREKPDVIFTTHSRVATLLSVLRPFLPAFRHIARMQNTPSLEKKNRAYSVLRRNLYAMGFRKADLVVAQTELMKKDAIELFGVVTDKVRVLPNPVDVLFVKESLEGIVSPFPSGQLIAVASGRLTYQKGFDVLLPALERVLVTYPQLKVYILGRDDGMEYRLKELSMIFGLDDIVTFLGHQSNPFPFYKYCDVFISSSRWEGFPNALLENYYLNTPIVATRCVPVIEELIEEGVNGALCNPNDQVGLASAIERGLTITRSDIQNPPYSGGRFETLI